MAGDSSSPSLHTALRVARDEGSIDDTNVAAFENRHGFQKVLSKVGESLNGAVPQPIEARLPPIPSLSPTKENPLHEKRTKPSVSTEKTALIIDQQPHRSIWQRGISAIGNAAQFIYENRGKIAAAALNVAASAGNLMMQAAEQVRDEIAGVFRNDPRITMAKFGGFVGGIFESFGVISGCKGVYTVVRAGLSLATFNLQGASYWAKQGAGHFKEAGRQIIELTGIPGLYRGFNCLRQGDYMGAAINASFGAVQIGLTVTGLGFLNIMSKHAQRVAVEGTKILAQRAGKELVGLIQKKIGTEVLKQSGQDLAKAAFKGVLKAPRESLDEIFVKDLVKITCSTGTEKLLTDYGVKGLVENTTSGLLKKISASKRKDLVKEFMADGLSKSEARSMVKSMQKALGKPGQYGPYRYHNLLQDEIVEEFTSQIKDDLMTRGLKDGFERLWTKAGPSIQRHHALSDDFTETIILAGKQGFDEGVELGVRTVVYAGVSQAFRAYRRRHDYESGTSEKKKKSEGEFKMAVDERASRKSETPAREGDDGSFTRIYRRVSTRETKRDLEGNEIKVDPEKNQFFEVSVDK